MNAPITPHRFSVSDYLRMAEAGILRDDDHVELIDGVIREMSPKNAWHCGVINRLTRLLNARVGDRALISCQNTLLLSDDTAPEPDLALLRCRADDYDSVHPTPADVLVLIEVSDTTISFDLDEKVPRYAAAGIPEVWVVDAQKRVVHQFSAPQDGAYLNTNELKAGELLVAVSVSKLQLEVSEILRSI